MIEFIYNDVDDLPKLLAMNALIEFYEFNNNTVLSKVSSLNCCKQNSLRKLLRLEISNTFKKQLWSFRLLINTTWALTTTTRQRKHACLRGVTASYSTAMESSAYSTLAE